MAKQSRMLEILFGVVVVIAIASIVGNVILNNSLNKASSEAKEANTAAQTAKKNETAKTEELLALKTIVGDLPAVNPAANEVQTDNDRYNQEIEKYLAGLEGVQKNYRSICEYLKKQWEITASDLQKEKAERQQIEANYLNLEQWAKANIESYERERKAAVEDRDNEAAKSKKEIGTYQANLQKNEQAKKAIQDKAEADVKAADEEVQQAKADYEDTAKSNQMLAELLHNLTRTDFDIPDGEIIGIDQTRGTVLINLGSDDGLRPRTTFTVYDQGITGISFPDTGPTLQKEGDVATARERSLSSSKASIEVIKILGAHLAEARILEDQLANPILLKDMIYTPLWRPGQRLNFVLADNLKIEGLGARDGLEDSPGSDLPTIKALIEANGGIVSAYIDDNGELHGEMKTDTTFLVLSETYDGVENSSAVDNRKLLEDQAKKYAVRTIRLNELLRMMGWKNIAPIHGFGKFTSKDDMRIPPSVRPPMTGTVSPLYDRPNLKARVNNDERPRPLSTGKVTDLYDKNSKTLKGATSGTVSDLFRQRRPAGAASPSVQEND